VNLAESMRHDWDERARQNAFHYIASWREDWNPQTFFASGEEDYQRLVAPPLARWQWAPQGKTILELGCGAGRMTRSFAGRFGRVFALDISPAMLARAKELLGDVPNVVWLQGNGKDLSVVDAESVDCVFSYIVLHHMPVRRLAIGYICEMLRMLKPGGAFLFQFSTLHQPTMNWKGRLAWAVVDAPWMVGLRGVSRGVASLLGLPPELAGKSWRGTTLNVDEVREVVSRDGGNIREISGEGTAMTWCGGIKSVAQVQ